MDEISRKRGLHLGNIAKPSRKSVGISVFSFFAGLGFLDLGFEDEGFEIVYVNELHKPFLSAYKHARQQLAIEPPAFGYCDSSITELLKGDNRRHMNEIVADCRRHSKMVGFIGGPPCPDFSVGGKNKGQKGVGGRLSRTYADLICAMHPDFFLFENVKGLWKTTRHRAFYEELKALWRSNGYALAERVINAIEYGTPQDRERIILFGASRALLNGLHSWRRECEEDMLNEVFRWDRHATFPGRAAFQYSWPKTSRFEEDSALPQPDGIPVELTVEYWFRKNDVGSHPNSVHSFRPKAGLRRFLTVDEGDDSKKSYKRLHRWRYAPTAAYGNNEVHLHPYKARRLSAAEALAIQSLPRSFELPPEMTLTDMFKGIGNGVAFLAAKMLARTIKEVLV